MKSQRNRPVAKPGLRSTRLGIESLEDRITPTLTSWLGGTGDWQTSSQWSAGTPGFSDDAGLTATGNYTVSLTGRSDAATATLASTSGTPTLALNGNTLGLASTFNIGSNGVATLGGGTVEVRGAASFAAPTATTLSFADSLSTTDWNNDGKLDAVAYDRLNSQVSILLNDGTGNFTESTFSVPVGPRAIAAGDVTGDGFADLVMAGLSPSYMQQVAILPGNGDGTFGTATTVSIGAFPVTGLALGDFTGDGRVDLTLANGSSAKVLLLDNTASGFVSSDISTGTDILNSLTARDLNGDGRFDLLGTSYDGNVVALTSQGSGNFTSNSYATGGTGLRQVIGVDVSGDGKLDAVAVDDGNADLAGMARMHVFVGNGDGTFGTRSGIDIGANLSANRLAAGDLNADGRIDLVTSSSSGVAVFENLGSGRFSQVFVGNGTQDDVAVGNVNGDGKPDLLTRTDAGGLALTSFMNTHQRGTTTNAGKLIGPGVIFGGFSQTASGSLELSAASATAYDKLAFTDAAVLGGTLRVTLSGGYVPTAGSSLNLLSGPTTGSFAAINVVNLPAGLKATPTYASGGFTLTFETDTPPAGDAKNLVAAFRDGYANLRAELPDLAATVQGDGTLLPTLPTGFTNQLATALTGLLASIDFTQTGDSVAGLRQVLNANFSNVTVADDGTSAVATLTKSLPAFSGSVTDFTLPYLPGFPGTLSWNATTATLTLTMGVDAIGFYVSTASGLSINPALKFEANARDLVGGYLKFHGADGTFTPVFTTTLPDGNTDGLARYGTEFTSDLGLNAGQRTTGNFNDLTLDVDAEFALPGLSLPTDALPDLSLSGTITRQTGWDVTYDTSAGLLTLDGFEVKQLFLGITGQFASANALKVTASAQISVNPGSGPIDISVTGSAGATGFAIGGFVTIPSGDYTLGSVNLTLANTKLEASFGLTNWSDPHVNLALKLDSDSASLTNSGRTIASGTGVHGFLDSRGTFKLDADSAALDIGNLLKFNVTGLHIEAGKNLPAGTKLFSVASANLTLGFLSAALGGAPSAALTDLSFGNDGKFTLGSIRVTMPAGYTKKLGIAEFLPFELQEVALTFPNGSAGSFDAFGLSIKGHFNLDEMQRTFGFRPILSVGNSAINGDVSMAIDVASAKNGQVKLMEFGPINVGFQNLIIGVAKLSGVLTLGGIQGGELVPTAGLDVSIYSTQALGGFTSAGGVSVDSFRLQASGNYDRSAAGFVTINLTTAVNVGLHAKLGDFFELDNIGFKARMSLTTPTDRFDPTFALNLDGISVGHISAGLGQYVKLAADNVVFDFTKTENAPLAVIGKASLFFGVPGDSLTPLGITGSIANLTITQQGLPRLNGLGVNLAFTGFDKTNAFSWFPVRVNRLGLKIGDMFYQDAAGNPTGVKNAADFTLFFSGGFDGSQSVLPLVATIQDVGLNVGKLALGQFPIENLGGISFGVAPFKIGPVSIAGMFTFGSVKTLAGDMIYYGRVVGEFSYEGLGAGIDLVISDRGPVLGSLSIPLGIPLDPFGLTVLSGATGSLAFGATTIVTPQNAEQIGNLQPPTGPISTGSIEAALFTLDTGAYTWDKSISIALKGTVITPYAPGVVSGDLTVGAYLGTQFTTAAGGLKFFAVGNLNVLGMTFASVKLLADFNSLLEPVFAGLVQVPDPSNPLGFLFPAKATAGVYASFKGVVPSYLAAIGAFVDTVAEGTTSLADSFFKDSLNQVVTRLTEDYDRPLSKLIFDVNGDGVVSTSERMAAGTSLDQVRTYFLNRIKQLLPSAQALSNFSNPKPGAFAATEAELTKGLKLATAFVGEFLYVAGKVLQGGGLQQLGDLRALDASFSTSVKNLFTSDSQRAMLAFSKVLKDAAERASNVLIRELLTNFDPKFLITAKIQPVIFGFPIGQSPLDGSVSIDKRNLGVSLTLNVPVRALVTFPLSSILGPYAVTALPIPELIFNGTFGLNLPYGDTIADFLINGIPPIDPNAGGWNAKLQGALSFGPYTLGKTGALIFPKNWNFLDSEIQKLYGDNANDEILTDRVQVGSQAHYDALKNYGGMLVYSQLYMPSFITDPVATFKKKDVGLPPADVTKFLDWFQAVKAALLSESEVGRTQFFIPSLSSVLQFNLVDFDKLVREPGDPAGLKPKIGLRDGMTNADLAAVLNQGYLEGQFNGKLLGINFAKARIEADLQHLNIRGEIHWLGNASVLFSIDSRKETIVRNGVSTVLKVPMVAAEVDLNNAENIRAALKSWGINPDVIPLFSSATIKFRAYSVGFDTNKLADPLKKTGGIELETHLRVNGLVDDAKFLFRLTPPDDGTVIPKFTAVATVNQLKLFSIVGGITIDSATLTMTNLDANGNILPNGAIRITVKGNGTVLGQAVNIDGVLNGDLTGFLTVTISGTTKVLQLIDGFSLTGTFRLDLTKPSGTLQATLSFNGQLAVPAWLGNGALNANGSIATTGAMQLNVTTSNFSVAGFTLRSNTGPLLSLSRDAGRNAPVQLAINGLLSLGSQNLAVSGSLSSATGGSLAVAFNAGGLNFGGLAVAGSAKLDIVLLNRLVTSAKLTITGAIKIPGVIGGSVTGSLDSKLFGELAINVNSFSGFLTPGLTVKDAFFSVGRDREGLYVNVKGNLELLSDQFAILGKFRYTPTTSSNLLNAIDGDLSFTRSRGRNSNYALGFGGVQIQGTTTLTIRGGSARISLTDGTVAVPLVTGQVKVLGSLGLDATGDLNLDLNNGFRFGGFDLGGTFRLSSTKTSSGLVVAVAADNASLTWGELGLFTVNTFRMDTLGNFNVAVAGRTLTLGSAASLVIPSATLLSDKAKGLFLLRVPAPTLTLNLGLGNKTFAIGNGIDVNLSSGDFRKELPAADLELGSLVKLSGRLVISRTGRDIGLEVIGLNGKAATVSLFDLVQAEVSSFKISTNGSVSVVATVAQLGTDFVGIKNVKVDFTSEIKNGSPAVNLLLSGGTLQLPGSKRAESMPTLKLSGANDEYTGRLDFEFLELGSVLLSKTSFDLKFSKGALAVNLVKPATIILGGSFVTLETLSINTKGTFAGTGTAALNLFGTNLASSTFAVKFENGLLEVNGSAILDLGIVSVRVGGELRSDGTYLFTADTRILINEKPLLFVLDVNASIRIERRTPSSTAFFRGVANGYTRILSVNYAVDNTGFDNAGGIYLNGTRYQL
jgi:FG-GAP-like repeat